uniref:CCHC-type domain-containing protein n=1 Tax=Globodera pallida TaxID=36090 RepID=A0A183C729_GLOPA
MSSNVCYNCNEAGHISRDCPQPRGGGGGGSRDNAQMLPQPDIDLNVSAYPEVNNGLVEAIDALESRMPLAFQDQHEVLKMQTEMLQLEVNYKELYKKIHEQSVMRHNLEKSVNKNIEDMQKGAVVAQKLVKAKSAYEEMLTKAEQLLVKAEKRKMAN